MTRYFCSKCGAHMFLKYVKQDDNKEVWYAAAGVLDDFDTVAKVTGHIFAADTLDGGIAKFLPSVAGETVTSYEAFTESDKALPSNWYKDAAVPAPMKEVIRFHCRCRAVTFYLKRTSKIQDPQKELWHVPGKSPSDPIRFVATHCFCDSCRLSGGGLFQTWIFVATLGTVFADPECTVPVDLQDPEKRLSGLRQFESSSDARREFCGTCGATAFYWNPGPDEPRIDVAHGLLDREQGGGALAETWLAWGKMGYTGDPQASQKVVKALRDGMQSCGIALR
ncbi:DUF636 domain-containing protein [Coprinopsis sp. MPI-PUGE-AT-0042]|nr:DUF636 domain-containing protein [Coprinopsis sp. MPI-PUGE-AT-0042]